MSLTTKCVWGGLALIVAVYVYAAFDPSAHQWFPKCQYRMITGTLCPGCGSQRAIHALFNGQFGNAMHYNAALVISIPFVVLYGVVEWQRRRWPRLHRALTSTGVIMTILALIILWWVGRNVWPFIAPALNI